MYQQQPQQQVPQPKFCDQGHQLEFKYAGSNAKNPGKPFWSGPRGVCGAFMFADRAHGTIKCQAPKQYGSQPQPQQYQQQFQPGFPPQQPVPQQPVQQYQPPIYEEQPMELPPTPKSRRSEDEQFICHAPTDLVEFVDEIYTQFHAVEIFTDGKTRKERVELFSDMIALLLKKILPDVKDIATQKVK